MVQSTKSIDIKLPSSNVIDAKKSASLWKPRLTRRDVLIGLPPSRSIAHRRVDWRHQAVAYKAMSDRLKLAREIAARSKTRFIEIPRERGGGKVPFTDEQLTAMRGRLTAENIGGS